MNTNVRGVLTQILANSVQRGDSESATLARGILESEWASPQTVSASGSTAINLSESNFVTVTLTANSTFSFTGTIPQGVYIFKIVQGGAGSFTVTWPSSVKWPDATAPTLTTTSGAWDIVTLLYDGTYFSGVATLNFVV